MMHGCSGSVVLGLANCVDGNEVEFPNTVTNAVTVDVALVAKE